MSLTTKVDLRMNLDHVDCPFMRPGPRKLSEKYYKRLREIVDFRTHGSYGDIARFRLLGVSSHKYMGARSWEPATFDHAAKAMITAEKKGAWVEVQLADGRSFFTAYGTTEAGRRCLKSVCSYPSELLTEKLAYPLPTYTLSNVEADIAQTLWKRFRSKDGKDVFLHQETLELTDVVFDDSQSPEACATTKKQVRFADNLFDALLSKYKPRATKRKLPDSARTPRSGEPTKPQKRHREASWLPATSDNFFAPLVVRTRDDAAASAKPASQFTLPLRTSNAQPEDNEMTH